MSRSSSRVSKPKVPWDYVPPPIPIEDQSTSSQEKVVPKEVPKEVRKESTEKRNARRRVNVFGKSPSKAPCIDSTLKSAVSVEKRDETEAMQDDMRAVANMPLEEFANMIVLLPTPVQNIMRKARREGMNQATCMRKRVGSDDTIMIRKKTRMTSEEGNQEATAASSNESSASMNNQNEKDNHEDKLKGKDSAEVPEWNINQHDMTVLRLRSALMVLKNEREKAKTDMETLRDEIMNKDMRIIKMSATIEGLEDRIRTVVCDYEQRLQRMYGSMAEDPRAIIHLVQW